MKGAPQVFGAPFLPLTDADSRKFALICIIASINFNLRPKIIKYVNFDFQSIFFGPKMAVFLVIALFVAPGAKNQKMGSVIIFQYSLPSIYV